MENVPLPKRAARAGDTVAFEIKREIYFAKSKTVLFLLVVSFSICLCYFTLSIPAHAHPSISWRTYILRSLFQTAFLSFF